LDKNSAKVGQKFCACTVNPINYYNHNKYDKKPWKKWGNIKGFSYQDIISLESKHGSDEAINNYKELERWIQQRKDVCSEKCYNK